MVKCFYLEQNGYPERGYRASELIDICLRGTGNQGLTIRDRENVITKQDIEKYSLINETAEFDVYNTYIMFNENDINNFINEFNCKVLCMKDKINDNNVIDQILQDTQPKH